MLSTTNEKKSFIITTGLYTILLLVLMFTYIQAKPKEPEGGIAVNFGTTKKGSGVKQPKKILKTSSKVKKTAVKKTVSKPKKVVAKKTTITKSKPVVAKKILTSKTANAPVIKSKPKKKIVKTVSKPKKAKVVKPTTPKKIVKKAEPKPDKSTLDIFEQLASGADNAGTATQGEGNSNTLGDQGQKTGSRTAKAYYGSGKGLDGDGNYRLGGRRALNKEKNVQQCNEYGTVVVRIEVNQNGVVTKATPGVRGTTNKSTCLMVPAKRSALATKFNVDSNAPAKQIGEITYQFRISN